MIMLEIYSVLMKVGIKISEIFNNMRENERYEAERIRLKL